MNQAFLRPDLIEQQGHDVGQAILTNASDVSMEYGELEQARVNFRTLDLPQVKVLQKIHDTIRSHGPTIELRGVMELGPEEDYEDCHFTEDRRDALFNTSSVSQCGLTHIQHINSHSFDKEHARIVSNIDSNQKDKILWNAPCVSKLKWWHVSAVMLQLTTYNVDAVFLFEDVYWRISGQRAYPDFSIESMIAKVAKGMAKKHDKPNEELKKWLNSFFSGWIMVDFNDYDTIQPGIQLPILSDEEFKKLGSMMALRITSSALNECYDDVAENRRSRERKPEREVLIRGMMTGLGVTLAEHTALAFGIPPSISLLTRTQVRADPNRHVFFIQMKISQMSEILMNLYDDMIESVDTTIGSNMQEKDRLISEFNKMLYSGSAPHGTFNNAAALEAYRDLGNGASSFFQFIRFLKSQNQQTRNTLVANLSTEIPANAVRRGSTGTHIARDEVEVERHVKFMYEHKLKPLEEALLPVTPALPRISTPVLANKLVMWAKIATFAASHYTEEAVFETLKRANRHEFLGSSRCTDQGIPLMFNINAVRDAARQYNSNLDDLVISLTSQTRGLQYKQHAVTQLDRLIGKTGRDLSFNLESETNMWMIDLQDSSSPEWREQLNDPDFPSGRYFRSPDGRLTTPRRSNPHTPRTHTETPRPDRVGRRINF